MCSRNIKCIGFAFASASMSKCGICDPTREQGIQINGYHGADIYEIGMITGIHALLKKVLKNTLELSFH